PHAAGDTIDAAPTTWAGFAIGDVITVSATAKNPSRTYTVQNVTATTLTLNTRNLVTGETATATVKDNQVAPAGDSEDFFIVNQLQLMVINQETTAGVESGDTLTLDGQAGSDTYVVNTTGTHGDLRNYAINVLDTGAADDGVDNLSVYG